MNNENLNKEEALEKLKKGLYSKTSRLVKKGEVLHEKKYNVKTGWGDENLVEEIQASKVMGKEKKEKSFVSKFLTVSVVFLVISLGAVLFSFFGGAGSVSNANIDIGVTAPSTVESGGELSLQVVITNNNATSLELADLIIEYPKGTRSAVDSGKEMEKVRETLDLIKPNESVRREFKSIMYGEEGSVEEVIIGLEYRIAGSNAVFYKERKYEVKISSSPINLIVSPIEEAISGQELEFSISIMSNSTKPIEDLLLSVDYPFGFTFTSAEPKPDFGDNVWKIRGDGSDVVKIKGKITGQGEDERVFKILSGTASEKDEGEVGAVFAMLDKTVTVKNPFMGIQMALNGDTGQDLVIQEKGSARVDLLWENNTTNKIVDGEVTVKLNGEIIDKTRVTADKGFYRSSDNTILWDRRTNSELAEIGVDDSGRLSFYFTIVDVSQRGKFVNPIITLEVSAKGNRVSEKGIQEEINSTISRTVKVATDLTVTPTATYYSGPFTNTGSLPPKVDKETTYTVTWAITNNMNDISGAKVTASLPAYVRWVGAVYPSTEKISYNPVGGEIIWNVGNVKAGSGVNTAAKEVSFQVAFLPSISQVGETPIILNKTTISGLDVFTNKTISSVVRELTTSLSNDPGFQIGDDEVVQ